MDPGHQTDIQSDTDEAELTFLTQGNTTAPNIEKLDNVCHDVDSFSSSHATLHTDVTYHEELTIGDDVDDDSDREKSGYETPHLTESQVELTLQALSLNDNTSVDRFSDSLNPHPLLSPLPLELETLPLDQQQKQAADVIQHSDNQTEFGVHEDDSINAPDVLPAVPPLTVNTDNDSVKAELAGTGDNEVLPIQEHGSSAGAIFPSSDTNDSEIMADNKTPDQTLDGQESEMSCKSARSTEEIVLGLQTDLDLQPVASTKESGNEVELQSGKTIAEFEQVEEGAEKEVAEIVSGDDQVNAGEASDKMPADDKADDNNLGEWGGDKDENNLGKGDGEKEENVAEEGGVGGGGGRHTGTDSALECTAAQSGSHEILADEVSSQLEVASDKAQDDCVSRSELFSLLKISPALCPELSATSNDHTSVVADQLENSSSDLMLQKSGEGSSTELKLVKSPEGSSELKLGKSVEGSSELKLGKSVEGSSELRLGKSVSDLEAQWQREAMNKEPGGETTAGPEEPITMLKEGDEEEALRTLEEEKRSLLEFVRESEERISFRNALREGNLSAVENRPDESSFFKLDSNLKKNTAFVKKLKNLTESQKDSLVKDINSLNITKYIGEVAAAIVEAKLKMTDVNCALTVCSLIHQRYAEFAPALLENWNKVLLSKKDEKVVNASKLRVDLRLFADLITVAVFTEREGLPVLASQLNLLTINDKEEHNNISIIISFCKHCGDDYAGLVPQKFKILAEKHGVELPRSQLLRGERQKACRGLLRDYFISLCKHLVADCRELRQLDRNSKRILQTKGELSTEKREKLEAAQQAFQKLSQNTTLLADLLNEELPELPEEDPVKLGSDGSGLNLFNAVKGTEYQPDATDGLFEDEDTRQFYESLPDLKSIIPGILYKDSEHASSTVPIEPSTSNVDDELESFEIEDITEMTMEPDKSVADTVTSSTPVSAVTLAVSGASLAGEDKQEGGATGEKGKKEEEPEFEINSVIPDVEEDEADVGSSMKLQVEAFLNNLPKCVNRELIDGAAVDFCMNLNTKMNRRKLVRALFFVQRTRYDLLPFYARLVATLNPCMPSVAIDLTLMLKGDFKYHVRKKDQINIESKLKSVRFIGEMVKFNMFPKFDVLQCLKMLITDFTHHNIDMACGLLETCGRFLYRTPETHHRIKIFLDVMMRKKQAMHLDSRYSTMIENAFYYSNPPDNKSDTAHKTRPPMYEYIRKLLYKDLSKTNIERVLRQMRKLNWNDQVIRSYAARRLTAIWNIRYSYIHCCANLLAGLAPYQELVGIHVIDNVLEDIRLGMEVNHPKYNQRRVSMVKYLGELYNYRLVESHVIFCTLYSFITFGVTLDDSAPPSVLDPPEHLFRVRLVCVLLDTCGQYFDRGSSRKKLDVFLIYFQRYFWHKKHNPIWSAAADRPFPMDVEYMMYDTIEALRPKIKISVSWEEASLAAEQQDKEFAEKISEMLKLAESTQLSAIEESEETNEGTTIGRLDNDEENDNIASPSHSQSQKECVDDDDDDYNDDRMVGHLRRDDDEKDSANDDDDDDDEDDDVIVDPISGDDEVAVPTGGLKHIQCTEDEDFLAAFDKMMQETMQARTQEASKIPVVDIAVPMHIKGQQKLKPGPAPTLNILSGTSPEHTTSPTKSGGSTAGGDILGVVGEDGRTREGVGGEREEEQLGGDNVIPFTVLSRRGNKQQLTTLNIPLTESIASKFREQKEVVRAEKERIKKVVLDIHERQEEEDYQEMIAQLNRNLPSSSSTSGSRDKRSQYQHPKGAPDADAIFGSKYVKR